jgi:hypothetical protein
VENDETVRRWFFGDPLYYCQWAGKVVELRLSSGGGATDGRAPDLQSPHGGEERIDVDALLRSVMRPRPKGPRNNTAESGWPWPQAKEAASDASVRSAVEFPGFELPSFSVMEWLHTSKPRDEEDLVETEMGRCLAVGYCLWALGNRSDTCPQPQPQPSGLETTGFPKPL